VKFKVLSIIEVLTTRYVFSVDLGTEHSRYN